MDKIDRSQSPLSRRVQRIQPSPTMAIDARFKALRSQGVDVVSFGAGEPDYPAPDHVKEAAMAAIRDDFSHYTAVSGIIELREAISRKLRRENGLEYGPEHILVTIGGKHALFNSITALCDEGDQVLVPAPYWVSYPEQVRLAEGEPIFVPTDPEKGFRLQAQDIEPFITSRTRVLLLNSPNNPSGAVYPESDLAGIAELARRHDLWVITDEIYERLVYDGQRHLSIAGFPGMAERTVVVNGLSKAYAMTGWRMGYSAAPVEVTQAMAALQGHVTSNAASIVQAASVAALDGPQEPIEAMAADYAQRRDLVMERLAALPGITCRRPQGAFYVFASIRGLLGRRLYGQTLTDADVLAELLLAEAKVAVVPGTGFGFPDHIRMSYATATTDLERGFERIGAALAHLE
ncbi:MAG: pyridoxal phosphate-dependent aminotransferase [Thermaerobacterales bacterium]